MISKGPNTARARKIRLFTVSAIVGVVFAGVFATVEQTTDLNGFAGTWTGVTIAVLSTVVVVVLRVQQSRRN
jgi:hypothetical protein